MTETEDDRGALEVNIEGDEVDRIIVFLSGTRIITNQLLEDHRKICSNKECRVNYLLGKVKETFNLVEDLRF